MVPVRWLPVTIPTKITPQRFTPRLAKDSVIVPVIFYYSGRSISVPKKKIHGLSVPSEHIDLQSELKK